MGGGEGVTNGHAKVTNGEINCKKSIVDIIGAGKQIVWNKKIKGTQLEKFREGVNKKYNLELENYWDLHKWSVDHYDKFWEEVWNYFGIISSAPYEQVVKNGKGLVDVEWFPGARLNYTENLLRYRDDKVALICTEEGDNHPEYITYAQLYEEVTVYAAAFRKHGLQVGDRVACYLPNRKEAIFAMLAATSMGAIWGGPLPFYGAKAASNIVSSMDPKFLLTCDRFEDTRIEFNLLKNLPIIVNDLKSIEKVVIIPTKESSLPDISTVKNSCFLEDFLNSGKSADGIVPEMEFEQFPINQPLFLNYTSGTTGIPKGLVHSAATLLPLLRDFGLHYDCTRDDVIFTPYPVGWNLWNLFVANFAIGAKILLYSGNPYFYSKTSFWDALSKYKVTYTFLVTSIVDKMEKDESAPGPDANFDSLKMITIGASPVKLQNFDYVRKHIKNNIFIGCLYGATEVIGVFSGFDFNEPCYSGEIQAPALGLDMQCFDSKGNSVVGERGELVITKPTMALLTHVWGDKNHEKLNDIYFNKFPGIWAQNDEAWIDPKTGGFVVIGRSDDTFNQNGERFGSADIYCAIHTIEELADYLCVPQDNIHGVQRAILFVKVQEGIKFNEDLVQKIKDQICEELTIEHIPPIVLETKEVPYNLNNKRMERIVRKIIATNKVPEVSNIKNPGCLQSYCNVPELQNY